MVIIVLGKLVCCWWCLKIRQKWHEIPSRAPIRLPENVVVDVVIVTKREGVRPEFLCLHWSPTYVFLQVLTHRVIAEELTSFYDDVGMRCERDAFDTLFDHAPDKLQVPGLQHISFELALNDGEQWWHYHKLFVGTRLPIIQYHRSTFNLIGLYILCFTNWIAATSPILIDIFWMTGHI